MTDRLTESKTEIKGDEVTDRLPESKAARKGDKMTYRLTNGQREAEREENTVLFRCQTVLIL